jgi:uncharacterized membrane protein
MADAEEPESSTDERPSSELIAERLGTAEADDDIALIHREMEFAAAERLMFFTDAVVAIALTLLALELPVPGGIEKASVSISEMVRDAGRHFDDYLAFLISFLVIGAHWRLHHRAFRYVRVASAPLISLNMLWLLLIVITPFTTKTLSVDHENILRFGLYAVTQAMQFTIFTMIIVLILRSQHVPAETDVQRLAGGLWQTVAMAIGFAVSIPLYLAIGQWAFAVWGVAPVVANLLQRQWQRRWKAKAT